MEITLEKKLELINKIDFFGRFTEADKVTMANMATFEKYAPNDKLITQNTGNTQLFFIINGNVDIDIDGKIVVSLCGGGHVFGEMSFVDYSPTSASVVANTKVVAMLFDTSKINLMIEPAYYKLRMDIYRSCAEILARRLIHTNSIAKAYIQKEKLGDLL
jgi:extracellular factor (EF) 3-hydroxypalmitic acid methyl ester biosynthesis protein